MRKRLTVPARVLIIAGSDSGGGAGIQADIKTVSALGGFAMTAVTAVTVQNTHGVQAIHPVPPEIIGAQIQAVMGDLGADAMKTGMLADETVIAAVALALERHSTVPLVADPVMVAKGGARLMEEGAISALKRRLIPLARLITPNIPEAEALSGLAIETPKDMEAAARLMCRSFGAQGVLVKGGHLAGPACVDLYFDGQEAETWTSPRIMTRHTHGTGCTLASAIAVGLGQALTPSQAIARARLYVRAALEAAPGFGHGHGPLWHGAGQSPWTPEKAHDA